MKKTFFTLLITLVLTSCGARYTPVVSTTPTNQINFATDIPREAMGCAYGLLWFPPFSNNISVTEIAKDNNFSKVAIVDYQSNFYLLFNKVCTVIHGE